jgi:hypothetical protein
LGQLVSLDSVSDFEGVQPKVNVGDVGIEGHTIFHRGELFSSEFTSQNDQDL